MAKKIQASNDGEPAVQQEKKTRSSTRAKPKSAESAQAEASVPAKSTRRRAKAAVAGTAKEPVLKTEETAAPKPSRTRKASRPQQPAVANQQPGVRIFQIFYQRQQVPLLDTEFEPYDNSGDRNPLLEFNVFRKLLQSGALKEVGLWGALSWKFGQKTGLSGAELKGLIAANPGYDVYFCNPHPDTEALYHNLWVQGETCHPNFLILCREFLQCADLPVDILTELQPSSLYSSANFFVGTPSFWASYIDFVVGVLQKADQRLSPTARAILYSAAADKAGAHAQASYLPFIVERLFSVYLQRHPSIKAFKLPLRKVEGQLNIHLQMLRQMKNVAHVQRSPWLAAAWSNYRTLYMTSMFGKAWVKKYLKAVTPLSVRFASVPVAGSPEGKP